MTATIDVQKIALYEKWIGQVNSPSILSLYAHIPFCTTRCTYCAFNTYTGLEALIEPFVEALCHEMMLVAQSGAGKFVSAHTLYFGGGTPSLLSPDQVGQIITTAHKYFNLETHAEITLEVNPGSIDFGKIKGFKAAGINRVSIGVQSAQSADLELFGRKHSFEDAAQAFQLARRAGFENVSIDLIYGAPYQTRAGWQNTLDTVLAWEPDHASLYTLTLEPQTLLERQVSSGKVPFPDSDLAADMYEDAKETLAHGGFRQYEISNWSRPGFESRHNRQYWLNKPFLGFGPGAHGAAAGVRYWNVRPVNDYIRQIEQGKVCAYPFSPALADHEVATIEMAMTETIILGLRLVHDGLDCAAFERRFGRSVYKVYGNQIDQLAQQGLLRKNQDRLYLTEKAYLVSNRVFVQFMPDD